MPYRHEFRLCLISIYLFKSNYQPPSSDSILSETFISFLKLTIFQIPVPDTIRLSFEKNLTFNERQRFSSLFNNWVTYQLIAT